MYTAKNPDETTIAKRIDMGLGGESPKPEESLTAIGEEPEATGSTTQADEGNLLDCAEKGKKFGGWLKNKTRIATWNVRSMAAGKMDNVIEEAKQNNISVLGIAEHRWAGQGHFTPHAGGKFIYSGQAKAGHGGVAIYLSKQIANTVLGYKPVNDRILSIRLQGKVKNIKIIQVYAPTSTADEEEIEAFYTNLQGEIDESKKSDITIVMGDFNAKVGQRQDEIERGTIGKFGLGERNERGERLVEFAIANNLTIVNTNFSNHPRRIYTWTSPDGKTRNQIDYIMIQKRWISAIRGARTLPGADCGSDHELLMAEMKLKLKVKKGVTTTQRYDVENLTDEYTVSVKNRFSTLLTMTEEKEPEEIANDIKTIFREEAEKHLRKRERKHQPWISIETLKKIAERKELKKRKNEESIRLRYNEMNKLIKKLCKWDKQKYIEAKCKKIEDCMAENRNQEMFKEIKNMTGKFQPRLGVIKDKNGKTLTDAEDIAKRWKEYCENMYARDGDNNDPPDMGNEDQDEDDLEPLRDEVKWAINSLKDGKSPGCDNIQAEMIKAAEEEGIDIYHALCKKIWKSGKWPDDWKKSIYIPLPKKGDLQLCSNYRTISLISHASKILLKIIMKRMQDKMEMEVSSTQAGFRKKQRHKGPHIQSENVDSEIQRDK